jgi:hypothetical protein
MFTDVYTAVTFSNARIILDCVCRLQKYGSFYDGSKCSDPKKRGYRTIATILVELDTVVFTHDRVQERSC